jgi:hypothetical protein
MSTPTDIKPEEAPEPVEEPGRTTVQWTDSDGKIHTEHPVQTECVGGCYQKVTA